MEGFGIEKLAMILLIVMVLFGGKKIPEIGASLGKGIREFKNGMRDVHDSFNEPPPEPVRPLPAGSVSLDTTVQTDEDRTPKRLLDV